MREFLIKANKLIGEPYNKKTMNCYTLVMQLLPNAPKIKFVAENLYSSIIKLETEVKTHNPKEVKNFRNKDMILLGRLGHYHHIGVYYNDGVIHADEDRGVVFDSLIQLKKIYPKIKGLRI